MRGEGGGEGGGREERGEKGKKETRPEGPAVLLGFLAVGGGPKGPA